MLEILLVVFSMIAVFAMFFLCYITHTLSKRLKDNDKLINNYIDEIDKLKQMAKWNHKQWLNIKKNKDDTIKTLQDKLYKQTSIKKQRLKDLNQ